MIKARSRTARVRQSYRAGAERFQQLLTGYALPFLAAASWVQLVVLDPIYLRKGRTDTADGRPLRRPTRAKPS
jgi:hypothetical protein